MSSLSIHKLERRSLSGVLVAGLWVVIAGLALWSLRPVALGYVPPEGWTHVAPELAVQDILLDESAVWIAGIGGVVHVDIAGHVRPVPVAGASSEMMLRAVKKDSAGQIWLAHRNGLSRVEPDGVISEMAITANAGVMRALALDGADQLWAGGETGLFRVAGNGGLEPVPLPVDGAEVTALLADSSGGLWIGTAQHGIMQRVGDDLKVWSTDDGLPHSQVTSLMQDSAGDVWVGTGFYSKGGAARFGLGANGWRIDEVLSGDALAGPKVRALFEDRDARLWLGHEYNGITIRRNGTAAATIGPAGELPDLEVTVIRQDALGGMWLGTLKGALHLSPGAAATLFSEKPGRD